MSGMHLAVLSPHRDDAAFSCGLTMLALLRGGATLTVVNVFTRSDYAVDLTTVDPALSAVDGVSSARLREDEAFVADLAALAGPGAAPIRLHDLHWLDAPLRLAVLTEQVLQSPIGGAAVAAEARQLADALRFLRSFDAVFVPFALGDHIDHRVAREAARLVLPADRICWYEDLPYAGRQESQDREKSIQAVMRSNPAAKSGPYCLQLRNAPHLKERLSMHYPSQIAPGVAQEMAAYSVRWSGGEASFGGEFWYADEAVAARLQNVVERGDARLVKETVSK